MAVLVPGRLRVCEVDMHMMLQTADVSARRLQPQTLIDDACFVRGIAMPRCLVRTLYYFAWDAARVAAPKTE